MVYYGPENVNLRAERIASLVRGIVEANQILKPNVPRIEGTKEWLQTFYKESIKTFASLNSRTPEGIPRLAGFPEDEVIWEKNTVREKKFGCEGTISLEDDMTNNIDVRKRTSARIANRIVNMIDTHIYNVVSDNQATTSTVNINTTEASDCWNSATRANRIPAEDIARAKQLITGSQLQSYSPDTILVSPLMSAYLLTNDYVMSSFDASGPDLMKSGNLGRLLGLTVLESPTVSDDVATVLQSRVCMAYAEAQALTTKVIEEPGKWITIRAWELGIGFLTDGKAVCNIYDTKV